MRKSQKKDIKWYCDLLDYERKVDGFADSGWVLHKNISPTVTWVVLMYSEGFKQFDYTISIKGKYNINIVL